MDSRKKENNCTDCEYKKEIERIDKEMDALFGMLKDVDEQITGLEKEKEQLKMAKMWSDYRAVEWKRKYEKEVRRMQDKLSEGRADVSEEAHYLKLYEAAMNAYEESRQVRCAFVDKMKNYKGKRVLFVLLLKGICGGGNVIVSEAAAMRRSGVDAVIVNLEVHREGFERAYGKHVVPVIYIKESSDILQFASEYDVVCATGFNTVKWADFNTIAQYARVAYYVQDYEPLFFMEGTEEYREARESYTLVRDMQCVTKTPWNQKMVRDNTGVMCTVIDPSFDLDVFYPQISKNTRRTKISIAAMIRPTTSYRAPRETMQILEKVFAKFGEQIDIHIFGANDVVESSFFLDCCTNFDYISHGVISPEQIAALLRDTDIFVDFSHYQAMGLTAMEAMASGCAVIVPENGGASTYAKNGINSLVVDTSNIDKCCEALSTLIEDRKLREDIALNAVKSIYSYSPERSAVKFMEAILGEGL